MNAFRSSLIAASVLMTLAGTSFAQVIAVETPVTGDESVLTTGTEVWGGSANGSSTLSNGVTFGSQFNNSNFVASTIAGSTVTVDQDGAAFGDQTGNLGFTDSALNNTLAFNAATGGQLFLWINGLTPGDTYAVQAFDAITTPATGANNNGAGGASPFNATESVSYSNTYFGPFAGNTSTLTYGQTENPADPGTYLDSGAFSVTATFVANSSGDAFLEFYNSTNGIDLLAAAQIRDVTPEPATYAMMLAGLALLGFCAYRKRALVA